MQKPRRLLFVPLHQLVTLDYDLMGTRYMDNPVKTLSSRKADSEGQSTDLIADELFRFVISIRFRRRGETMEHAVTQLLSSLFEGRGELSYVSCVVTADRGYGKPQFADIFGQFGMSAMLIAPDCMRKAHPFISASSLKMKQDGADDNGDADNSSEDHSSNSDISDRLLDRPRHFVIPNGPCEGHGDFHAKFKHQFVRSDYRVSAVWESGVSKVSKVVRFSYMLPAHLRRHLSCWAYTTKGDTGGRRALKQTRPETSSLSGKLGKALERSLSEQATFLTVGQHCCDWFLLRQFRLTATMAADVFSVLPTQFCESALATTGKILERTEEEWFKVWMDSWFSKNRSTEPMMRGSRNENAVLSCFEKCDYVACVRDVGLMQHKEHPFLACSPDAMSYLTVYEDFQTLGWSPNSSRFVEKDDKVLGYAVMATVEVKINVSNSSLSDKLLTCRSTEDPVYDGLGFAEVQNRAEEYISNFHLRQCVYQCIVTKCDTFVYLCAAETGLLYSVVVHIAPALRDKLEEEMVVFLKPKMDWLHRKDISSCLNFPSWLNASERLSVSSKMYLWEKLNTAVLSRGPCQPVHSFRHGTQTLYCKTKGGVDSATQMRALLRGPCAHLPWAGKVVTQGLKALLVNSFLCTRMREYRRGAHEER